jgi:hypothetical protein
MPGVPGAPPTSLGFVNLCGKDKHSKDLGLSKNPEAAKGFRIFIFRPLDGLISCSNRMELVARLSNVSVGNKGGIVDGHFESQAVVTQSDGSHGIARHIPVYDLVIVGRVVAADRADGQLPLGGDHILGDLGLDRVKVLHGSKPLGRMRREIKWHFQTILSGENWHSLCIFYYPPLYRTIVLKSRDKP